MLKKYNFQEFLLETLSNIPISLFVWSSITYENTFFNSRIKLDQSLLGM